MRSHSLDFNFDVETTGDPENEFRTVHVEADVRVSSIDPGNCCGPPESCYPSEGGEVEIDTVLIDGAKVDEPSWPKGLATAIEENAVAREIDYDDSIDEPY